MKQCRRCDTPFEGRAVTQVFCSPTCQKADATERWSFPKVEGKKLAPATVGALSEMLVCADLLKQGFEVFRAVSPSCSCDLAILKDHRLVSVEVRTGYRALNGSIQWPKKDMRGDVLAIVIQRQNEPEIIYSSVQGWKRLLALP